MLLCPQTKFREAHVFTPVCDSVHRGSVSVQSRGVSVQGDSVQEGSLSRGSLSKAGLYPGGLCQGDPLYSNDWVVCVILECILVSQGILSFCSAGG